METIVTIPTDEKWYVVFLAFCQNFVKEAVPYTYLIFITKNAQEEDLLINFIAGGLYFGLTQFFTPLSCALANWYSFKMLNIVGPCLSAISMLASHFIVAEHNELLLILSFGILGGFACSMLHVTSKLMPSYWFCNRKGIAHCIAHSGYAVGFLLITTTTEILFLEVFKKKMMIFFFFAGLYVPLFFLGFISPLEGGVLVYFGRESSPPKQRAARAVRFRDEVEARRLAEDSDQEFRQRGSFRMFKTHHNLMYPRVKDLIGSRDITLYISDPKMRRTLNKPWEHGLRLWEKEAGGEILGSTVMVSDRQTVKMVSLDRPLKKIGSRPMYRTDIFFTWNVFGLPVYYRQDNQLDFHLAMTRATSTRDYMQEKEATCCRCICPEAMTRTLLTMLDCHIYFDLYMGALQICVYLMTVGQLVPLIFIYVLGEEAGLGESRAFFLVISIGIGQVLGRLVLVCIGALSTGAEFYSSNIWLYIFGGVATIAITFTQLDIVLIAYSFVYGIIHGLTQSLRFSAIYSIARMSNMTNAVGHSCLWQGFGFITSASLSGYLFSKYEKAWPVFFMSGGSMTLAGLMLILVKIGKNRVLQNLVIDV